MHAMSLFCFGGSFWLFGCHLAGKGTSYFREYLSLDDSAMVSLGEGTEGRGAAKCSIKRTAVQQITGQDTSNRSEGKENERQI